MKTIINLTLIVAVVSLAVGMVSRFFIVPVPIVDGLRIEAHSFLAFTNTCLLMAIALMLLQLVKAKQ